jgi:tRNA dimethylallyltransferase
LKALLRGLFIGPGADWSFRRQLEEEVRTVGSGALHERLALVDPLAASRLHPNDTRRMIRALEVYRLTGKPISHWQVQFDDSHAPDRCRVFVIQWPREMLHQRIDARVEWMFANGLVDEVRRLTSGGRRLGRTASQAVGYREVLEHLAGRWTLAEARREVEVRTRRFARRQGTWFRSLSECRAVPLTADTTVPEIVESILRMGRGGPDAEADKRLD